MLVFKDWRCLECSAIYDRRVHPETEIDTCEACGGIAERIWLKAPGVLIRPDGYNLRPDEPGYSKLPKTDRTINRWQLGADRQRKPIQKET